MTKLNSTTITLDRLTIILTTVAGGGFATVTAAIYSDAPERHNWEPLARAERTVKISAELANLEAGNDFLQELRNSLLAEAVSLAGVVQHAEEKVYV